MGSAKLNDKPPNNQMTMENKASKAISIIKSFFQTKKQKQKLETQKRDTQKHEARKPEPNPVDSVQKSLKKLDITNEHKTKNTQENSKVKEQNKQEIINKSESESEDDISNFTVKIVEEDRRSGRVDSQSSEDSGFSETTAESGSEVKDVDEVVNNLEILSLDEGKKKKLHTVLVARGPDRLKLSNKVYFNDLHPYTKKEDRTQINQVNKSALCGGNVTVNPTAQHSDSYIVDKALTEVGILTQNTQNESELWQDLMEVIKEDTKPDNTNVHNTETSNVERVFAPENFIDLGTVSPPYTNPEISPPYVNPNISPAYTNPEVPYVNLDFGSPKYGTELPQFSSPAYINPIEEFNSHLENPDSLQNYEENVEITDSIINLDIFPTPPRSENISSPESETFYPNNCSSEYTLSPERSSPICTELEKYQDITHIEEKIEKKNSLNLTLKNFKDMQKEIANKLSKEECCAIERKSCKQVFDECMGKLKAIERKNLCIKVSKLDLRTCYGVLQNVLLNLSKSEGKEPLQIALFALVCQRVLAEAPALFVGDFGLNVLKSSALRCPHAPHLTRIVVGAVYTAVKTDPKLAAKNHIFDEVDGQGDNLVLALSRGGDRFAPVLAEITRTDERRDLPRLFKLEHVNNDGQTALHVACAIHSAAEPRLHIVHVLLDHAGADLWKGDVKGGDTALHLAVNSLHCDLGLILLLFRHIDRKLWKKLAHANNMSSVTPLEYARSCTRSTTRENYPPEVLSFLMKCR